MTKVDPKSAPPEDSERRLREAQETLDAIRAGEVDAVLVDGPKGQQVYTLESPDKPFQLFVDHMQEGAVTIDAHRTIVYSNRYFSQLVDAPLSQIMGAPLDRFIAPASMLTFRSLMNSAFSVPVRTDCSLTTTQSKLVPVHVAVAGLPALGEPMFAVVFTDLSERERANELQAAHTRALADTAARDQFLAVVSHELRTPLHAILGWVQMLSGTSEVSELVNKGLRVIERNAKAQAQLIEDLLDVSRIIAGKVRLELQRVELVEVVESALSSIRPAAEAKEITLRVSGDMPRGYLQADPARIQQIIWNLLSNAVKYTGRGGAAELSLATKDAQLVLSVKDNGRGISADFLPHVFNRFSQADSSFSRSSGGLGLGLSIVKHLTEMHGGTVSVYSDGEGHGSTFTVCLPLQAETKSALSQARAQSELPNLQGLSVLLVEDEADARELLAMLLGRVGAHVLTAESAQEAMQLLAAERVDVLVSDIGLPGRDGYALIKQVRAHGKSARDLPAVALTAFARTEDRRRALSAGFQSHVTKPVDAAELSMVLASLTGRVG
ncbi:MAG: ATP-binding protein [Polyangiales bacterium]